jgi:hypothetical protein
VVLKRRRWCLGVRAMDSAVKADRATDLRDPELGYKVSGRRGGSGLVSGPRACALGVERGHGTARECGGSGAEEAGARKKEEKRKRGADRCGRAVRGRERSSGAAGPSGERREVGRASG